MLIACVFCNRPARRHCDIYPIRFFASEGRDDIAVLELPCICSDCAYDISKDWKCPHCGVEHVMGYSEGRGGGDLWEHETDREIFLKIIEYLSSKEVSGTYMYNGDELRIEEYRSENSGVNNA